MRGPVASSFAVACWRGCVRACAPACSGWRGVARCVLLWRSARGRAVGAAWARVGALPLALLPPPSSSAVGFGGPLGLRGVGLCWWGRRRPSGRRRQLRHVTCSSGIRRRQGWRGPTSHVVTYNAAIKVCGSVARRQQVRIAQREHRWDPFASCLARGGGRTEEEERGGSTYWPGSWCRGR